MFLVLTQENEIPSNDSFYLLGKWCIHYHNSLNSIKELEEKTLFYPYDQVDALHAAYRYLQEVDKNLFPQIISNLNAFHQTNYSNRYWRITLGYWWREFLEIVYERYLCIKSAARQIPEAKVKLLAPQYFTTPYDSKDFSMLYKGDYYNHQIYGDIIEFLAVFNIEVERIKPINLPVLQENWLNFIKYIICFCSKWNNIYLASSYLINKFLIKLAVQLKIFPTLDTPRFLISTDRVINFKRRQENIKFKTKDEFENLILSMLPRHLPKIYWEDFCGLKKIVNKFFPKKRQRCVLTANAFACNEGFKLFTAQQVEKYQTPFIILQHGGQYGCGAWNSSEDYEKEIADYYLTYGWREENNNKIIPFIMNRFHIKRDKVAGKSEGNIIWVMASFPRFSYTMYSVPVGPQFVDYLNDQALFLSSISNEVRNKLICRSYRHGYGWADLDYVQRRANCVVKMDDQKKSLADLALQSRLIVCTYNATAHLETFLLNVPTVLYWNPKHWLLRPEASIIHQRLLEAGILYYDPVAAAKHIVTIQDKAKEWWQSPVVQAVREDFCAQFAATDKAYIKRWRDMLLGLAYTE